MAVEDGGGVVKEACREDLELHAEAPQGREELAHARALVDPHLLPHMRHIHEPTLEMGELGLGRTVGHGADERVVEVERDRQGRRPRGLRGAPPDAEA